MKAVVAAFNKEKALAGAFSMITNLRMELFQALVDICWATGGTYSNTTLCKYNNAKLNGQMANAVKKKWQL